ncbi:RDD family protein [Exiguobacterium sp. RIT594]|uniref:RDD family protein n=1 Tax=Exiguobacterium sp. RIT594 TaxID=2282449 RepID=UPI000DF79DB3|nr:RDD family protein [Exiguobacterium sp. RIT594]RDB33988.1 RDD family protein [Exiguobacterium sp. RIT594]
MDGLLKRRIGAGVVDLVVQGMVSGLLEKTVLKRIKNKAVHSLITEPVVNFLIETVQLSTGSGQTVGQRLFQIQVVSENGQPLAVKQIAKRIVYRETIAPIKGWKNRKVYLRDGSILPEDEFAGTRVIRKIN